MVDDNASMKMKDEEVKEEEEKMEDEKEEVEETDPVKSIKAFKKLVVQTLEEN